MSLFISYINKHARRNQNILFLKSSITHDLLKKFLKSKMYIYFDFLNS